MERRVRGITSSEVELASGPGNCGYLFKEGERYVVYAYRHQQENVLVTNICTGTKPLAGASADIQYFDEMERPATGGRVYGQITQMDPNFELGATTKGGPLQGVSLTLTGESVRTQILTDADGRFDIRRLAPGAYELNAELGKQFVSWRPIPLRIENDRSCVELRSAARLDGRIRGTLLDEAGRPASGVIVEVAAASTRGSSRPPPHVERATTDRNGAFEFTALPPGEYVVGTELSRPPRGHHLDRRRYYPGLQAPQEARTVKLGTASRVQLDRFQLPPFPTERVIEGVVIGVDGAVVPGATVILYGAGPEEQVSDDGRFRFTLPYGARFVLSARKQVTKDGRVVWARTIQGIDIEREDRDRTIELRLKIP